MDSIPFAVPGIPGTLVAQVPGTTPSLGLDAFPGTMVPHEPGIIPFMGPDAPGTVLLLAFEIMPFIVPDIFPGMAVPHEPGTAVSLVPVLLLAVLPGIGWFLLPGRFPGPWVVEEPIIVTVPDIVNRATSVPGVYIPPK